MVGSMLGARTNSLRLGRPPILASWPSAACAILGGRLRGRTSSARNLSPCSACGGSSRGTDRRRSPPGEPTGRRASPGPRRPSIRELTFSSTPKARKGADLGQDRGPHWTARRSTRLGARKRRPGGSEDLRAGDRWKATTGDLKATASTPTCARSSQTHLNEKATMLLIEWWTPAHGLRRIERERPPTRGFRSWLRWTTECFPAASRTGLAAGPGLLPGLLGPLAGTTCPCPYRQVGQSLPP